MECLILIFKLCVHFYYLILLIACYLLQFIAFLLIHVLVLDSKLVVFFILFSIDDDKKKGKKKRRKGKKGTLCLKDFLFDAYYLQAVELAVMMKARSHKWRLCHQKCLR